jgi:hypothetical protein
MKRGRFIHLAALAGVLALAAGAGQPAHGAAITTPAGLQALPGPGQVLLTYGEVPNATGYNIYRRTPDQTPSQAVKVNTDPDPYGWFIDDGGGKGLPNGTNFLYSVKAVMPDKSEGPATAEMLAMPQIPIGQGFILYYLYSNPALLPATLTVDTASDTLTFRSNGEDLWDQVDSGDFLAMPVAGDYSVQCEVLEKPAPEAPNTSNNVKVGPQIRDDLTVGSRYAYLHTTSARGVLWERREAFLGNNGSAGAGTGTEGQAGTDDASTTYPLWLRLTKTGTMIAASQSKDGTTFTQENDETNVTDYGRMNPVTWAGIAMISSNISGYGHAKLKLSSIQIIPQ